MDNGNSYFEHIFSSFIDGVILLSPDETIIEVNPAIEEMFQASRDSFLEKSASDIFPEQSELTLKVRQTLSQASSFRDIPCRGIRKSNQTRFPVSVMVSPYLMNCGTPRGAILHVRDMSLVKELEENARRLDELSNLGVLSLGMAHEIKNPLVAISGSAQLLRKRLPDEHHKFLDVVIKESERINRMMERMLAFARPVDLEIKLINIHQLLEEILCLEKEHTPENIIFIQDYDPSLPQVEGDEDELIQVFLNLIRNALQAMPEGGNLELVTRIHSNYTVKTDTNPKPRQAIVVEVRDSGTGIESEDLKHIFTPFHTTKSKGSGLGLPLSLRIVENHQGKIKVKSQLGKGTRFQVFLPVEQ